MILITKPSSWIWQDVYREQINMSLKSQTRSNRRKTWKQIAAVIEKGTSQSQYFEGKKASTADWRNCKLTAFDGSHQKSFTLSY